MSPADIETVGVVGCGLMGSGIAQVCAGAGFRTIVCELDKDALASGMSRLEEAVHLGVAPPLLKRMVLAGHLGRKSGRGFYRYND